MCLMLQCVAVRFSMLQCVAVCCSALQYVAVMGLTLLRAKVESLFRIYTSFLLSIKARSVFS